MLKYFVKGGWMLCVYSFNFLICIKKISKLKKEFTSFISKISIILKAEWSF